MSYTLGEASKAVGKSKATIHRAVKSGKISATRNEDGSYSIEPAELHRVYRPVSETRNDTAGMRQSETPNETPLHFSPLQVEVEVLRKKIELIENMNEREMKSLQEQIEFLKELVEKKDQQFARLLEDKSSKKGGFFRLFKKQA